MTYPGNDWDGSTSIWHPEPEAESQKPAPAAAGAANAGFEPKAVRKDALGRLAGGIAHDFNNLLTTIIGYSELCMNLPEGQGRLHEGLLAIQHAGEKAAILTRQILAYSRQQVLAPEDIDLNELVARAAERIGRNLDKGLRIQTALAPGLGKVRVDPAQLELVILNLAENALEAMPSGGSLTLATRAGSTSMRSQEEQHLPFAYAVLEVRDTGIGMDDDLVSRIFDPFFTTKPVCKGAGLGLSAVEGIVLQSGGEIQVASKPGLGTTIRISLPFSGAGPIPADPPPANARAGQAILVVEDEEIVRKFCRVVLEQRGFRVLEASEGSSAMALIRHSAEPIDLLLTDLHMPGIPGEVLACHFLKEFPESAVLLMSATPQSMNLLEGCANPNIRFLQKPFLGGTLLDRVHGMLRKTATAV